MTLKCSSNQQSLNKLDTSFQGTPFERKYKSKLEEVLSIVIRTSPSHFGQYLRLANLGLLGDLQQKIRPVAVVKVAGGGDERGASGYCRRSGDHGQLASLGPDRHAAGLVQQVENLLLAAADHRHQGRVGTLQVQDPDSLVWNNGHS